MDVENAMGYCVINKKKNWKVSIHKLIYPLISNLEVSYMKGTTLELEIFFVCDTFRSFLRVSCVRIINPYFTTLDINLIIFVLFS